jgi:hypothetical protein
MTPQATLSSIVVTPPSPSITVGNQQQFIATGVYSDSSTADLTGSVTWSSSDATIATINSSGFATAVGAGTAGITAASGPLTGSASLTVQISALPPPPAPGTPADFLRQAQTAMFQLLIGQQPNRIETPQLGAVQFVQTTPAQLQRVIDYLQALVQAGNIWPTNGSSGNMNAGSTGGRKPFSFYGWP